MFQDLYIIASVFAMDIAHVESGHASLRRFLVSGSVHTHGSDDVLGQWLSAFRTARNERQKRKPVWEGGEAQDSARHTTKAEQRPSGRHVATHRLFVMPSAWVVRPPSLSIGVVLARKIRPPWYGNILDGSVITARDAPEQ